jgi:hypothetical protein
MLLGLFWIGHARFLFVRQRFPAHEKPTLPHDCIVWHYLTTFFTTRCNRAVAERGKEVLNQKLKRTLKDDALLGYFLHKSLLIFR